MSEVAENTVRLLVYCREFGFSVAYVDMKVMKVFSKLSCLVKSSTEVQNPRLCHELKQSHTHPRIITVT